MAIKIHHDYDDEHHLIRTVAYPSPGQAIAVEKTYYANGLVSTIRDGRGVATTFTHDSHGNPDTTRTFMAPPVNYDYDAIGRLAKLTDQAGAPTSFLYVVMCKHFGCLKQGSV